MAAALAGGAAWRWLPSGVRPAAAVGLSAAWAASTASMAALVWFRRAPFKSFLHAFGAGVALRGLVFAALAAAVWGLDGERQAAVLSAYALGVLGLLIVEYRHLRV